MSEPLAPRFEPKAIEALYAEWESKGYFHPQSDKTGKNKSGKPYVIVIPPPNVTGILHMGHALNNTIQDILIRWHRMRGRDALWVPGVDHAGIATQNVVEKKLAKEKKTRHDLGREKFLEEVWKWKEENGSTITRQLRRLGASCDWSREGFTMSPQLSKAVRETFVTLYERGLIYQGYRIINWCPRCQTALSDEESEHKEVNGGLYLLKYPLAGKGTQAEQIGVDHVVVATTRPETMLGDTAVAVHPEDERYKHLIGSKIILPLVNREIPVIGDEFVDREFGTGFVKVTPAHDPNDFEMGKRHNLPQINVMTPSAKINEQGGPYEGLDRFEARKKVIADLEAQNLFVKKDSHTSSVGHCYRCATVVEPYLSKQWFVKMKGMAEKALKAHAEGKTVFTPDRWTKVYTNWLEGIRDWCISRQIWWGHQIPVWYDGEGGVFVARTEEEALKAAEKRHGKKVTLTQDPDVLDTWFSSWLWPFSTLGWPEKTEDLKHFYPTSDLITAPEIIFFWVSRMIMAGLEFLGEVPFSRIYIHGTVRASDGRKMSKSLGNSIDPLEVIDEMGADALRHSMIMLSAQDVFLSREKFEVGRNFVNKLWNASRFALMNLEGFKGGSVQADFDFKSLPLSSRWILSRLQHVTAAAENQLSSFGLSQAATELYHFVWNDFCDWFIELAKPALTGTDVKEREAVHKVLFFTLERILRLLHPFMPFVTEEIWRKLKDYANAASSWPDSLMLASWPDADPKLQDKDAEKALAQVQNAVAGIRELRVRLNVQPAQPVKTIITSADSKVLGVMKQFEKEMIKLGRLESLDVIEGFKKDKTVVGAPFAEFEVFVRIEGLIDFDKERVRVQKSIDEKKKYIQVQRGKLSNENFVKNAPVEVVEAERQKLSDAEKVLNSQEELLELFK